MENIISTIVEQQIPSFLKTDSDLSKFLVDYYEWLEASYDVQINDLKDFSITLLQNESTNTLPAESRNIYSALSSIKSVRNSDTTPVSSLPKFVYEYMNGLPLETASSIRSNLKLMKNFYENKGNENSLEFLFKLLFNKAITISYPSERMITLSNSKWIEKTFIRLLQASAGVTGGITISELDALVGTYIKGSESGAVGYLDSYTVHSLTNNFEGVSDRHYYKLSLLDVDENNTFQKDDKIDDVEIMKGLTGINFNNNNVNIYPTSQIVFVHRGPSSDDPIQSFGAAVKIKSFTKNILTVANIATDEEFNSGDWTLNLINDFFEVYEYDTAIDIEGKLIRGQTSDAYGTVIKVVGSKVWTDDINGTFLTDYQKDTIGGSELVDIIDNNGSVITSLRIKRRYTASKIPAELRIVNNYPVIDYPGLDYIFNPIEADGKITITGLGSIKDLEIVEMGYNYEDSDFVDIYIDSTDTDKIGTAEAGVIGTEKFFESSINTLDGEAKLRDSNYYQEFSYEIKTQTPTSKWVPVVTKLTHPAGMKVFGADETVSSPFDLSLTEQPDSPTFFINYEPHEIIYTLYEYSATTNYSLEDEGFLGVVYGNYSHSYTNDSNWVDYSSVTDYGGHNSRVFFNNFDTNTNFNDTDSLVIRNQYHITHGIDIDSGKLDADQNVTTNVSAAGRTFPIFSESVMEAYDRNIKEEVGRSYSIFDYNISTDFIQSEKNPEVFENSGYNLFNIEYIVESEADGFGDTDVGRGVQTFASEHDIVFDGSGDGGNIHKHPKGKIHYITNDSSYYMGES